MSNFLKRSLTGFLFIVVIVLAIMNALSAAVLFFVIVTLATSEFSKLLALKNEHFSSTAATLTAALFMLIILLYNNGLLPYQCLFVLPVLPFAVFISELFRNKANPISNISFSLLPMLYIAVPFVLLYTSAYYPFDLFNSEYHYEIILGFFCMLWASDTGAYLTGISIGKHKLFERISPKKTWEGSIGGAVFSVITAVILSHFYALLSMQRWIIMSFIIVAFSNLGDLVESLFKRSLSIKDSGNILPGHGGLLDRFDGLLLSAPIVLLYLSLISNT